MITPPTIATVTQSSGGLRATMGKVFSPYKVSVVLDRNFGEGLSALTPGVPVWIVGTPTNKAVAQRLWKQRPQDNSLTGITTFDDAESASPEEMFLSILGTIDLHHGPYSADPPYTILEVIGADLTERIRAELSDFGFNEFETNLVGFRATRQLPTG